MTATISRGTLNLRFMQNAQNAEQELENKSIESVVNDESHWEVTKQVRDAWGINSGPSSSSLVTHEASYLPFLFSPSDDASGSPFQSVKLRGRRTWNKRGQEVTEAPTELLQGDNSRGSSSARPVPAEDHTTSKRLTSISSFRSAPSSKAKETKPVKSRSGKSARELIHEATTDSGGIRFQTERDGEAPSSVPAPAVVYSMPSPPLSTSSLDKTAKTNGPLSTSKFLKPAGVDEPSDNTARGDGSRPTQLEVDMTHGTRRRQNPKRERDDHREVGAQTADRKRKKSGAAAA